MRLNPRSTDLKGMCLLGTLDPLMDVLGWMDRVAVKLIRLGSSWRKM